MTINNYFKDLVFDPDKHTYKANNKPLISTTKFISRYDEEFPSDFASMNVSKRDLKILNIPLTDRNLHIRKKQVLNEWNIKKENAAKNGTKVHDYLEQYALLKFGKKNATDISLPETYQQLAGIHFINWIYEKGYELIEVECRMYLLKLGIAGTTDVILRNPATGKYILCDYKTNKDIFKHYNKRLLSPFNHLISCPYNKYQIQLSTYQVLFESISTQEHTYEVEDRWLIWLKPEEYSDEHAFEYLSEPYKKTKLYEIFSLTDYSKEIITHGNN